jgi:hypothetical protein
MSNKRHKKTAIRVGVSVRFRVKARVRATVRVRHWPIQGGCILLFEKYF